MAKSGGARDSGGGGDKEPSYADRLKTNVRYNQLLKRNILDISLDKTDGANFDINPGEVHSLLVKLGVNVQAQVEGYQIYPGRPF